MSQAAGATNEAESLDARVHRAQLTPAQRQVARLLLEDPERFMFLSAAEMAAQASVSQPSVSRLARALGYGGYGDLLEAVRLRAQSDRDDDLAPAKGNRHQQAIDDEIALLRSLRRRLSDDEALGRATELINGAGYVVVLGLRISGPLAQTFAYRLGRMRPNVRLIATDGSQAYDDLALIARGETPTLVVFAMPRYPRPLLGLIDFARSHGYRLIVITDTPASPLAGIGEETLIAEINWGLTFGTHTAATVLSAMLAEEVARLRQDDVRQRLDELDDVASSMDHYLTD
jgi:DNA-binding MurR/RpiR family transcriptional regulator